MGRVTVVTTIVVHDGPRVPNWRVVITLVVTVYVVGFRDPGWVGDR